MIDKKGIILNKLKHLFSAKFLGLFFSDVYDRLRLRINIERLKAGAYTVKNSPLYGKIVDFSFLALKKID